MIDGCTSLTCAVRAPRICKQLFREVQDGRGSMLVTRCNQNKLGMRDVSIRAMYTCAGQTAQPVKASIHAVFQPIVFLYNQSHT